MSDDMLDLDAIESDGEPFRFRHGGDDYELPPTVDIRAAIAQGEGRLTDALQMLLGEEQWQRILDSDAVLDDVKFEKLMTAYYKHLGTTAGESSASTRSSRSTGRPSKRTSSATTKLR